MKRISTICILIVMILSMVGCAKVVDTKVEEVQAKVVDTYHRGVFVQPMIVGKITTMITHPAVYNVTLEYDNITTTIDNRYLYDYVKENNAKVIKCNLITTYYDNGEEYKNLEEIKEEN